MKNTENLHKETKKVYSISLRPSFHMLAKQHALSTGTNVSKLIEDIVAAEIKKRDRFNTLLASEREKVLVQAKKEFLEDAVELSPEHLNIVRTMRRGIGDKEKAGILIDAGMRAISGYRPNQKIEGEGDEQHIEETPIVHEDLPENMDYLLS